MVGRLMVFQTWSFSDGGAMLADLSILNDDKRVRASIAEDGLRRSGHDHVRVITEIEEVAARMAMLSDRTR